MTGAMTGAALLIDDEGRFWSAGDQRLRARLGTSIELASLWPYAIRNLGFIGLGRGAETIRVWLRPATVSPVALTALYYSLADSPVRNSVLSTWQPNGYRDEITGNTHRLMARLRDVNLARDQAQQQDSPFERYPLDISGIDPRHPISSLHQLWRNAGLRGVTDTASMCDRLFEGVFTIAEEQTGGNLMIRDAGFGYKIYSRSHVQKSIGTPIADDPNREYGRFVNNAIRQVLHSQQPLVEFVSARIRGSDGDYRVSYRRIIAPVTSGSGSRSIVTASTLDSYFLVDRKVG